MLEKDLESLRQAQQVLTMGLLRIRLARPVQVVEHSGIGR